LTADAGLVEEAAWYRRLKWLYRGPCGLLFLALVVAVEC